jgi:hypothetical protein
MLVSDNLFVNNQLQEVVEFHVAFSVAIFIVDLLETLFLSWFEGDNVLPCLAHFSNWRYQAFIEVHRRPLAKS